MKNDKEYTQRLDLSGMKVVESLLGDEVVCNSFLIYLKPSEWLHLIHYVDAA